MAYIVGTKTFETLDAACAVAREVHEKTGIVVAIEEARLRVGQKVTYSGFAGVVKRLYVDGATESGRMYEVKLKAGEVCVCGSDLVPVP